MGMNIDPEGLMNILNGGNFKETDYSKTDYSKNNRPKNGRNKNNGSRKPYVSGNPRDSHGRSGESRRADGQPDFFMHAPFNFVSFSKQVCKYDEPIPPHNKVEQELYSGEISYEMEFKTPVFTDDGTGEFAKDPYGRYIIPGSTMRGLIRNNLQILGLCSFADDIDDYHLMYRNVAGGIEEERYKDILGAKPVSLDKLNGQEQKVSILKNVRAGYIRNKGGEYEIIPTEIDRIHDDFGEMNYYVISERKIIETYLKGDKSAFAYLIEGENKLQHKIELFQPVKDKQGNPCGYKGTPNEQRFIPFYMPVSYKVKNLRYISAIGKPGKYPKKGFVLISGSMKNKKAVYVIPKIAEEKEAILIPEKDVKEFQIDYQRRKNTLVFPNKHDFRNRNDKKEQLQEFFDLPKDGETKPVFYIQYANKLYFGFTPNLRLMYEHTIKDGLPDRHKADLIDYSKAIFGYAGEKSSRKSRVSFTDATMCGHELPLKARGVVLAEPKPTDCFEYLEPQNGSAVSYNTDDFQLRGVKQYWLHDDVVTGSTGNGNENIGSSLKPLPKGVKFTGKVRFHNLKEDELGLLLWSIRLEENSWMNVGKAKPYGYGVFHLTVQNAMRFEPEKAYTTKSMTEAFFHPYTDIDIDDMVQKYQIGMRRRLAGKEITKLPHIREFFRMKDSKQIPEKKKIEYMSLKEFTNCNQSNEYKGFTITLPNPIDI